MLTEERTKITAISKSVFSMEKIQHEGDLIKCHLASIKKGTVSYDFYDWLTNQPYRIEFDPAILLSKQ